jgi:hypothetical protein
VRGTIPSSEINRIWENPGENKNGLGILLDVNTQSHGDILQKGN